MIGAIKRRWKSKKSKVLSKGSDLSTSTDSCPTSRGFAVDGCEDFDKMIKPPSPRQIHPVLDKGDMKCSHHHHTHYPTTHHPLFSQHPILRKKSSTLPSSEESSACPFIRVNSGRIELVSAKENPGSWKSGDSSKGITSNEPYTNVLITNNTLTSFHPHGPRSRGGSGQNDARHSWCGSAIREDLVVSKKMSGAVEQEDEQVSPGVPTRSNNTTKPPLPYVRQKSQLSPPSPAKAPRKLQEDKAHRPPPPPPPPPPSSSSSSSSSSVHNKLEAVATEERVVVLSPGFSPTMTVGASAGNVRVLLSPLKERLTAIEKLTANLASCQDAEKSDYEKCVEDLATQVSRAVALQTLMKSEFEKLQERVEELENHNKTMATMIIPTLMKLHDPEEGEKIHESTSQSMVSEAESRLDEGSSEDGKIAKTDSPIPRTSTTKLSRTNPTTSSTLTSSTRVNTKNARSGGVMSKSDNHQPQTSPHTTTRLLSSSSKSESTLTSSPAPSARNLARTELSNQSNRSRSSSSSRTSNYTKIPKTSGIPRMSSPRPPPHSSSSPVLQSPARVRKSDGGRQDNSSAPPSTSVGGSRLPVRRAIASAISRIPPTPQPTSHRPVHSGKHNNSKFSKVNGVPIPAGVSRASSSAGARNNPSETDPTIQLKSKTGTKDEGYSTMSSEALAEQEKSTLERSTLDRTESPGSCTRSGGVELLRVHSTIGGASSKSKTMHKSNTFNTFREIRLPGGYRTEDRVSKDGKLITPDARNFTSLPVPATRASILMNRRELSSNLVPAAATSSHNSSLPDSPRHLPKKSPLFPRKSFSNSPTLLTSTPLSASTRPPAFNNVRIIRGIPYELSEGELDAHPSSSTILWEDSDDSDVLFLPLEISSESSSRSTLIPPALESNPLLPATKIPSKLPTPHIHNPLVIPSKPGKGERDKRKFSNPSDTSPLPTTFSLAVSNNEDSALIEKWMRLEDVRNEVQWDDEWAWDWDGVQPPPVKSLRSIRETEDDNDREGDDEEEEDEDFWKLPSLAKERIQHLTDLFQPLADLNSFVHTLDFQESSKGTLNPSSDPSSNTKSSASAQIDSSTWTKSKCGKIKAKLAQFHATEDDDQIPDSFPAPISNSLEKRHKKKKTKSPTNQPIHSTHTQLSPHPSPAHTSAGTQFNPDDQEQLLINHQLQFHPDHENESSNDPFLDSSNPNDGPPPVIEFTPEFYHLVNYGSNLSFSDNESNSPHHHHHHHGAKPPPSSTRLNSPSTSINYNHSPSPSNNVNNFHKKLTKSSKMDDKVSQTDFVSSFENMSISSELFTECRNCLEIIKKLVAEDCVVSEKSADPQPVTTLDRQISIQAAEKKTDAGSPTTWVSIPHGLPSTEVDRILEILSSSESEDILSPSK